MLLGKDLFHIVITYFGVIEGDGHLVFYDVGFHFFHTVQPYKDIPYPLRGGLSGAPGIIELHNPFGRKRRLIEGRQNKETSHDYDHPGKPFFMLHLFPPL